MPTKKLGRFIILKQKKKNKKKDKEIWAVR